MEAMRNANRTIVVTGSNSGIGLAVGRRYYETGANVVLHGRDRSKLDEVISSFADRSRVAHVLGNIADRTVGEALVGTAVERFGGLDLLVNNAGTFGSKAFVDVTDEELDRFVDGNLKGTYRTSQAAVRQMLIQGAGSIVNIGTVLIDHAIGGFPATAPLVSKGGIHALTVNLAAELASAGIRVNAVAPGIVRTPLHDAAMVDDLRGLALVHRIGEAEEIAAAVDYLDNAEFVTGHILPVDGGFVSGRP
jgi:NAD(P)-dependent dehydrogenase (short-subunit alcohol dehydrogenase family)